MVTALYLSFKTEPEQIYINSNKSSLKNKNMFVSQITNLLSKGCINEVSTEPSIVNPLTVEYSKSSKPRLVLGYIHINPHLHKYQFKYEDGKVAREMFDVDDFIFSYDLKFAYHHIEIFEKHQQVLSVLKATYDISHSLFYLLVFLPQIIFFLRL